MSAYPAKERSRSALGIRGQTYRTRLHHLLQRQVHPRIAHDQVAVQVLAVLELDEDGVALRRVKESEGQLRGSRRLVQVARWWSHI